MTVDRDRRVPTAEEVVAQEVTLSKAIDAYYAQFAALADANAKRKAAIPHFARQVFRGKGSLGGEPSDSLAVHPKQRDEVEAYCKKRGVPTDYTPGGRPIITSIAHQKAHARIRGHRPKRGW